MPKGGKPLRSGSVVFQILDEEVYAELPIYAKGNKIVARTKVSLEDLPALRSYRWCMSGNGYASRGKRLSECEGGRRGIVLMHRQILGLKSGDPLTGDHINIDKLDNRRSNLRAITHAQNQQNRRAIGGTSRFLGVYKPKNESGWIATARLNRRKRFLGRYETEEEAARVAAEWRKENMPFSQEASR